MYAVFFFTPFHQEIESMVPTKALRNACMELLAADVATLAPVAGNKIALYTTNVSPSENSVLADFTLATFTGSTPKVATPGTQPAGYVPGTGDSRINISPPVGGFRFECTGAPTPSQTIYGFIMTDNAGAVYLAGQRFTNPIVIVNVGDTIDLGDVNLTLLANSIS
jgi:hypothetical protein